VRAVESEKLKVIPAIGSEKSQKKISPPLHQTAG
jgi:hypothetical protein